MSADALLSLKARLAAFAAERDWEKFHSPKNLAMALSVEVAELVEVADVFIYLLRLSDRLGVDLLQAADAKIALNERKYPADRVRGDSRKYTEYD
jgi:NTP pyrophosphatase (non-canonical NTP hydrolase)